MSDLEIPGAGGSANVSDAAYDATAWDGDTDAPSKNAIRDKIETLTGGHDPVTVTDSDEINFTLTGQAITAVLKAGSIVAGRLATAVQTSLGLADTATQPGDLATVATSGDYDDLSNKPDLSAFDNISEHANAAAFPGTGAADKFYLAQDTGILYRWTGSAYAIISAQLALGETSSTAYRGDRGATAFAHVSATDNPHSVSKAQVGLSNVPNTDFTSSIAAKVSKTGNETVAGVKTFSSSPIVPAPTTDLQAATKKYVDDNGGGGDLWSDLVDADIIPDGDETRDLGSAARQFKKIFTEDININNDIILDSGLDTKFLNNDGNTVFEISTGPSDSYVNYTFVRSADTTQTPSFGVWGDDTNVSLNLITKGTGKVQANGVEVATVRGAVNAQTGTTYTLVIGDEYLLGVTMDNAAANTITIPTNASVAFPIGTTILITQLGAGATTIAAAGGVTTVVPADSPLLIGAVGGSRVIQKRATNEWLLI